MMEIVAVVLLIATIILGAFLLIRRDLITQLAILAGIYLIQAAIFLFEYPLLFALILIILGWMACAVIGAGRTARAISSPQPFRSEMIFYMLTYLFAVAAGLVLVDRATQWFPLLPYLAASIGLVNICQAVVLIGFSKNSQEVILGLLLLLAGFETIFLHLEISLLVIGLMGGVKLGLAFIGSFWMGSRGGEPSI